MYFRLVDSTGKLALKRKEKTISNAVVIVIAALSWEGLMSDGPTFVFFFGLVLLSAGWRVLGVFPLDIIGFWMGFLRKLSNWVEMKIIPRVTVSATLYSTHHTSTWSFRSVFPYDLGCLSQKILQIAGLSRTDESLPKYLIVGRLEEKLTKNLRILNWSCECFLTWWYPQNTPKWSFLVGKQMVVGYHHFRKPSCRAQICSPHFPFHELKGWTELRYKTVRMVWDQPGW